MRQDLPIPLPPFQSGAWTQDGDYTDLKGGDIFERGLASPLWTSHLIKYRYIVDTCSAFLGNLILANSANSLKYLPWLGLVF